MKDLVVGAIPNYGWNEVKNWALSLNACGFKGRKVLLAYSVRPGLNEKLQQLGIEIFVADFHSRSQSIYIPHANAIDIRHFHVWNRIDVRHFHIWNFLKDLNLSDYRFIISTDVRDLIFQSNPSDWLEENIDARRNVVAPSEGIELQYEPWNAKSMRDVFGHVIYEKFKNVPVLNCGTIAGRVPYFQDFELALFSLTERSLIFKLFHHAIDQTSLILLAYTSAKNDVTIVDHDAGWACQCRVMLDPRWIDAYRPHLVSPEPKIKDGLVYTSKGQLFSLVHQYDRVPSLNEIISEKYR